MPKTLRNADEVLELIQNETQAMTREIGMDREDLNVQLRSLAARYGDLAWMVVEALIGERPKEELGDCSLDFRLTANQLLGKDNNGGSILKLTIQQNSENKINLIRNHAKIIKDMVDKVRAKFSQFKSEPEDLAMQDQASGPDDALVDAAFLRMGITQAEEGRKKFDTEPQVSLSGIIISSTENKSIIHRDVDDIPTSTPALNVVDRPGIDTTKAKRLDQAASPISSIAQRRIAFRQSIMPNRSNH